MAWTISIKVGCKFRTIYPNYRNYYTKFEMILIQIVIPVYRKIYWRILDIYAESTYLGPYLERFTFWTDQRQKLRQWH